MLLRKHITISHRNNRIKFNSSSLIHFWNIIKTKLFRCIFLLFIIIQKRKKINIKLLLIYNAVNSFIILFFILLCIIITIVICITITNLFGFAEQILRNIWLFIFLNNSSSLIKTLFIYFRSNWRWKNYLFLFLICTNGIFNLILSIFLCLHILLDVRFSFTKIDLCCNLECFFILEQLNETQHVVST